MKRNCKTLKHCLTIIIFCVINLYGFSQSQSSVGDLKVLSGSTNKKIEIIKKILATSPINIVSYPMNSKVLVEWANVSGATDYIIEYKITSDTTWNIFPDDLSTTPGVTITGLTNGVSYDFRVSSIVGGVTSNPSFISTAIPTNVYNNTLYNQILTTGQSLSIGYAGTPVLSTTQPFSNKMFNTSYTTLVALKEPATGSYTGVEETKSSGMANMLSYLTSGAKTQLKSIVTLAGVTKTAYSGLKKGTTPYTNSINRMKSARDLTNDSLAPYRISAITVVHGEQDEYNNVSAATYAGYLAQWQNDYETDAKTITGQNDTVPLFLCQMASWTAYNHTVPTTAIGQLMASENNPSKIVLVTPKYMLDYNTSDGVHLTNYSYRRLGEYYGKVMKQVLIDKKIWKPFSINTATFNNKVITATFNVPTPPLQFDTSAVLAKANYGFEYFDDDSTTIITSVNITSPTTIQITLNHTPTGLNPTLAYAYTGTSGSHAGRNIPTAPRGNLCDSDTTQAYYKDANVPASIGNVLKNWCVTFIKPITNSLGLEINSNKLQHLKIFPNPANSELTIETAELTGDLIILTADGQVLIKQQITNPQTHIDISSLASGIYFIKLKKENSFEVEKFVKQ